VWRKDAEKRAEAKEGKLKESEMKSFKDFVSVLKEGVEQPSGDDSIPTQTSAPGQMDGERASKKRGFKTSLAKISKNSVARETEEGWEEPKIKGSK